MNVAARLGGETGSAGLHAPLLERSGGRRRGDELDQGFGGVRFFVPATMPLENVVNCWTSAGSGPT